MAGGFNAGSVFVKLGFDVDDSGADRYDRRVADVKRRADRPIKQEAKLDVDERGFQRFGRGVDKADKDVGRLRVGMGRLGGATAAVATGVGGAGIAAAGAAVGFTKLVGAYQESYKIGKQTEAVIRSTGGAANVSAKQVGDLATALSKKSGQDDEAIQSGINLLLTFKDVRNEAGKGNDIFNQASSTLLDMSTAMGTDAKGSAIQLGKALNDPVKGVAALGRVGVTFTDQQKEQIKTLVESGKTMDAQKIILRELKTEFGGSAAAQATNTDRLKVSMGNLAENIGGRLAPLAEKAAGVISKFVDNLNDGDTGAGKFGKTVREVASAVGRFGDRVSDVISDVVGWFKRLYRENADTIASIGKTFSSLAATAKRAFNGIKDAIGSVFGGNSGTGRDIRKIVGHVLDFQDAVLKVYNAVAKRALPGIITAFRGLATIVRGVVRVISGILSGDFGKAWDGVKDVFSGGAKFIGGVLRAATAPIRAAASAIGKGLSGPLSSIWSGIKSAWRGGIDFILGGVSTASGAIASLLDAASKLPFVGDKFKGLAENVRKGQKRIDEYRESLRAMDKEHGRTKNIKDLQGEVSTLRGRLKTLDKGTEEYRDTAEKLRSKQRVLNRAMSDAKDASKKGEGGIRNLGKASGNAARATATAASNIIETVQGIAKGLGVKAPKFSVKAVNAASGAVDAATGAAEGLFRATGGWVGQRGQAGHDTVRRQLPRGSAVLNRHQIPIVEAATRAILGQGLDGPLRRATGGSVPVIVGNGERILDPGETGTAEAAMRAAYGMGLGDLFAAVQRPHYLASGGIVPVPGFPGESAASSVIPDITSIARRFGLTLTDAYGQGHASPGHTKYGTAADFAGPDSAMDSAVRYLVGRGYVVGYDGRYGSKDWPGHGPAAGQGGSNAHLHVELGSGGKGVAGGGGGGAVGSINAPKVSGPAGALASIAQGSSKAMAKLANEWASSQTGAMAPHGKGGSAQVKAWAIAALSRPGSPFPPTPANVAALVSRIMQESGGDPNAQNNWDSNAAAGDPSVGLAQTIGATFRAYRDPKLPNNPRHPIANLAAALNYMKDRYGRVVAANGQGYAEGGFVDGDVEAFASGGKPGAKKKVPFKEATLDAVGLGAERFRSLRASQSDRVGEFDRLGELVDVDDRRYGLQERRNDLTDEVLVDEETGKINVKDVRRRADELAKLARIKKRIRDRLAKAKQVAHRTQKTYTTIIERLRKAVKAATGGKKSSKARKKAADSYRSQIRSYVGYRKEWKGKESELGFDLEDVSIDLRALRGERASVLGTKAVPQDPPDIETPEPDDPVEIPVADDPTTSETPEAQLPPSAEDIARGVAQQFASFQQGRAELFGSFGGNFIRSTIPTGLGGDMQEAAGTRFFGGGSAGTDGGVLGGAGGQGGVVQNITFAGPQPADPHVFTATALHELQALSS